MTPHQARAWIAGLEILGMRFGLGRIHALLAALGDPQRSAPALHVVGTNGKSSTVRLASAVLASQGLRTGAYLSPHVTDWPERIQVEGRPIDEAAMAAALTAVREASEGLALDEGDRVTQFEALTAAAFWAFRGAAVDALVIEAGLGGRWDATNVLQPAAAVALTNVAIEHTELLGDTEEAIAAEKLAVCADGHERLVVGPLTPPARAAVDRECARRGLRPLRYGEGLSARQGAGGGVDVELPDGRYPGVPLALRGRFQRDNLAVAMAGARMLLERPIDAAPLGAAVAAVEMPGRVEIFPGEPLVIIDGAHNPAGMEALVEALPGVLGGREPVAAVTSVLGDKDARAMVGALARVADVIIATRSSHARAVPPRELAGLARAAGRSATTVADPLAALAAARAAAGPSGAVVVAGSLYLLADLRDALVAGAPEAPARLARARKGIDPTEAK